MQFHGLVIANCMHIPSIGIGINNKIVDFIKQTSLNYHDKATKKLLCFQRIDKEATTAMECNNANTVSDWDILLKNESRNLRIYHKIAELLTKLKLRRSVSELWILYAKYLVKKAIRFFGEYEEIYTNRLHGHILACLMDKKNSVYDNSYGKNSAYASLWTKSSKLVTIKDKS